MTEPEYLAALARIEDLMGAVWGTPEGNELQRLSAAVQAYEKEHYPI